MKCLNHDGATPADLVQGGSITMKNVAVETVLGKNALPRHAFDIGSDHHLHLLQYILSGLSDRFRRTAAELNFDYESLSFAVAVKTVIRDGQDSGNPESTQQFKVVATVVTSECDMRLRDVVEGTRLRRSGQGQIRSSEPSISVSWAGKPARRNLRIHAIDCAA